MRAIRDDARTPGDRKGSPSARRPGKPTYPCIVGAGLAPALPQGKETGKMNATEFAGKAVIVTGAAQGIGRTIAEQFLWQGARVLIFDLESGLAVWTGRQMSPGREVVVSLGGDVSKREDVHRAVETCVERFGQLDV